MREGFSSDFRGIFSIILAVVVVAFVDGHGLRLGTMVYYTITLTDYKYYHFNVV